MQKRIKITVSTVALFLLWTYVSGCEAYTRNPMNAMSPRIEGEWRVASGDEGDVPPGFEAISIVLRDPLAAEGVMAGVLRNANAKEIPFMLSTAAVPNFGPWMVFQGGTTDVGWGDRVWLGMKAYENPERDVLLIGFSGTDDGEVYPAEFFRR